MQAPSHSESTTQKVVWEYNNRTQEAFKDSWRESWQNTERVSATVTKNGKDDNSCVELQSDP